MASLDAVVVGSGPNGLAAALTLARAGRSVLVLEATETIGGGCRTTELTLPGFRHDVCATSYSLTASRFFRELDLPIDWIEPPIELAHPFDDGSAAVLRRSLEETAGALGQDSENYRELFGPFVECGARLIDDLLAPPHVPRDPIGLARFGRLAVRSAKSIAESRFATRRARALFAGIAAHSMLPLEQAGSCAAGLLLGTLAHRRGWVFAAGGSQSIVDALASELRALGGEIRTGVEVRSLADVPPSRAVLFDVTPVNLARIASDELPDRYARALKRFRHGPGSFKIDFALDGPVPWRAVECAGAGVVHLGGTLEEIATSERQIRRGEVPDRPFAILAQASLFDSTRAPSGRHTVWAYCHVPNGSTVDMTDRIERQIERFAPGFRDRILAKSAMGPAEFERYNANYVGGDIGGGLMDLRQIFMRPAIRWNPYTTPNPRLFLCSASTPPGGGVHGMCGYCAARTVLRTALK